MPKKRKTNKQSAKPRILILCEGEKTEPCYFKRLRADRRYNALSSVEVVVFDEPANTARELVQSAIKHKKGAEREKDPYAEIWVAVDKDGYTKHPEAFDQAVANNIFMAFSSVCFEYWFLLHFTAARKALAKCDDLIEHLRKHYLAEYAKRGDYYETLRQDTKTAINHARQTRITCPDFQRGEKPYNINPFTNVDVLVERLIRFEELKDCNGKYMKLCIEPGMLLPVSLNPTRLH